MSVKIKVVVSAIAAALVFSFIILGFFGMDGQTNNTVIQYLNSLGWQVDSRPAEISHIKIPEEFDTVFSAYNAIQTESGFDLTEYRGRRAARYSYTVRNHTRSADGNVRANVYVCKGTIIAADISQSGKDGFIHSINSTSDIVTPTSPSDV